MYLSLKLYLRWFFWSDKHKPSKDKGDWDFDRWCQKRRGKKLLKAAKKRWMPWRVALLIQDQEANPNVVDKRGMTPLLWAIKKKRDKVIAVLMLNGASAEAQPTGLKPWDKQDTETKDPLERAVLGARSTDAIDAIAQKYTNLRHLEEVIQPLVTAGLFANNPERVHAVGVIIQARIDQLREQGSSTKIAQISSGVHRGA